MKSFPVQLKNKKQHYANEVFEVFKDFERSWLTLSINYRVTLVSCYIKH